MHPENHELTSLRFLMNLSAIAANLPALKNFIYGLAPGQTMRVSPGQANHTLSSYFANVSSPAHGPKFVDRVLRRDEMTVIQPDEGILRTCEVFLASEGRRLEEAHIAHGVPRSGVFEYGGDGGPI